MLRIFSQTRFLAIATLTAITMSGVIPEGAFAQGLALLNAVEQQPAPVTTVQSPLPGNVPANAAPATAQPAVAPVEQIPGFNTATEQPATLQDAVAEAPAEGDLTPELKCLASAIYFEAGHETLAGQLAVGRVIVARTKSGRFPESYCGVVRQHAQFSFVHGGEIPSASNSSVWHRAVAIAHIADAGSFASPVEGALYFHAARVNPNWRVQRMARIDNHVFYH
jgi:N-acetylmuramoyl-L-alanine amidase